MIDLHAHLAVGIDDGPDSADGAIRMARAATEAGITRMAATPHVDDHFGLGPREILEAIGAVRRTLAAANVPLDVVPGAEIAVDRSSGLSGGELEALRLGRGRWILLECPLSPDGGALERAVFDLQVRSFNVLLAHPERSPGLQRQPGRLTGLVARGARCSITAGSLRGQFGKEPQRFALKLLQDRLVHNVASDAHDARKRPPNIGAALDLAGEQLDGLDELSDWLVRDVPAAVLDGGPLPAAPDVELRPRRRRTRRHAV